MNVDSVNNPLNEEVSNLAGLSTHIECLEKSKDELANKNKIYTNLNYNLNFFRNLVIVIDFTEKMIINDFKPSRHKFLLKKIENFIINFFKYNFMSTITIITIKNSIATLTSPYSSDPDFHLENLRKEITPEGFPSIYNALSLAAEYLSLLDKHNNDIVFFYSSHNTYDRANLFDMVDLYVELKTEIHFVTFETPFEMLYVFIH